MSKLRNLILGGTLAALVATTSTPALADHYRRDRGGDTTGAAIAGGIVGLAVGAAIASSGRDRFRDGYYYDGPRHPRYRAYYVYRDYPPRWRRDWEYRRWGRPGWGRPGWGRPGWGPRGWDHDYPRYRGWDGPRRW